MKKTSEITIVISLIILSVFRTNAFSEPKIHGFISQGFLKSNHNTFIGVDTDQASFQFNEMGINFISHAGDGLQIGIQFFAYDLGDFGNDEIMIDWAYADYYYRKWMGIRAGSLKIHHGLFNDTRDIDMLRVCILLPQCTYQEMVREMLTGLKGASFYGELPGSSSYSVSFGQTDKINDDSGFTYIFDIFFNTDIKEFTNKNVFNGKLSWETPLSGLSIGGTYIHSEIEGEGPDKYSGAPYINDVDMTYNIFTISGQYNWGNLVFIAEYTQSLLLYTVDSKAPAYDLLPIEMSGNLKTGGYYGSVSFLATRFLEIGVYYSEFYYDINDKEKALWRNYLELKDDSYLKQTTLSFKFIINENWLSKFEIHDMNGRYFSSPGESGVHKKNWLLFAAKVSYSF